jgi:hypothetical protein
MSDAPTNPEELRAQIRELQAQIRELTSSLESILAYLRADKQKRLELEARQKTLEHAFLVLKNSVRVANRGGKIKITDQPPEFFYAHKWTCPYGTCDGLGKLPGPPWPPPYCQCEPARREDYAAWLEAKKARDKKTRSAKREKRFTK